MHEYRLRRTRNREKRPRTYRLLNEATTRYNFVTPRLPEEMAVIEHTYYRAIDEALTRFENKDPDITEEILQQLCQEYLDVDHSKTPSELKDNQKTTP